MGFGQLGSDVEVGVIPQELGAGPVLGSGVRWPLDIDKVFSPRGLRPSVIGQCAIDQDWAARSIAEIAPRRDRSHGVPFSRWIGG